MDKRKGVMFGLLILLIVIVSLYFDSEIVRGVSFLRNDILNDFFLGLTFISSSVIIFFFLTSLFLWKEHKRKWILPLWITLGVSVCISFVLKVVIQKQRPFQLGIVSVLSVLEKANHLTWNFAFPSFHAMLVFCSIPILSKQFPRFKYIWIIFASLVAFSRVYFGLHFLSDVIVGGLIGYIIGMIIVRLEKEYKFGEKIYGKVFGK
ncbi:phosphatase PAP2 family protein [Candidatus Pacearchaeota archaeon]|nr:phosphatase PAP2 family protein [Candidatus Pacearchaeota archaeon]